MERKSFFVPLFFLFFPYLLAASEIGIALLPKGRPFLLTFADPKEIRMALLFEGDKKINAAVGNYFSLLALRPKDGESFIFHLGVEGAGFFTMRQGGSRLPLETADGLMGAYLEGRVGPWESQLRYTHISAHLADGSDSIPITYTRETAALRFAWVPSDYLQLYSGFSYLVNTTPSLRPWGAQWGGSFFMPLGTMKFIPFLGIDTQWKQETTHNPSLAIQIGLAVNNPPDSYHSFRFFYAYYSGADTHGQFYNRSYTSHSVGIEMQI